MKNQTRLLLMILALSSPNSTQAASPPPPRTVCAPGATTLGLDVSNYQPHVQWPQVRQSHRAFAFIKATEGVNVVNSDFAGDWPASLAAGVLRGAYHFFVPADDPVQQADHFLSTLGRLAADDLPPMFDWEATDKNATPEQIVQRAQVWLDRVEAATGRVPMIYTYPSYWQGLGAPQGFERYPLFIATYGVRCPEVPSPWKTWTFWQYQVSSTPGIGAKTDLDMFNGTSSALQTFITGL